MDYKGQKAKIFDPTSRECSNTLIYNIYCVTNHFTNCPETSFSLQVRKWFYLALQRSNILIQKILNFLKACYFKKNFHFHSNVYFLGCWMLNTLWSITTLQTICNFQLQFWSLYHSAEVISTLVATKLLGPITLKHIPMISPSSSKHFEYSLKHRK